MHVPRLASLDRGAILCLSACLSAALAGPGCGRTPALTDLFSSPDAGAGADLRPLCAEDPGNEGRRHTTHFDLSISLPGGIGRLQATVFGPSEDSLTISPTGAPFPVVILSPAAGVRRVQYLDYAYRLANHGFVVLVQDPRAEVDHKQYRTDTRNLIDWLDTPAGVDSERVMGRVDVRRVGLGGHGLGGKVSFLVAESDPRVRAVLGIDPVDSAGSDPDNPSALPGLPALQALRGRTGLLGEDSSAGLAEPCTPPGENYQAFFDGLPSPAFAIVFGTAGHMDFIDDLGGCMECQSCGAGADPADKQAIHKLAVKYTTAFFQTYLKDCAATGSYLTGAELQRDRDSGLVDLRTK